MGKSQDHNHAAGLLERVFAPVSRHLPDRAFPGDLAIRKNSFSSDKYSDRPSAASANGGRRDGTLVDPEHKGRGYELSKGKYVEIEEDELKAIQVESTHTGRYRRVRAAAEIDKRYLDKPYYIAPNGKTGIEAFVVIRDAMQDEERVALARIVMAHREHIIMLEPLGKGLLGTTLRYDYEVRSEKEIFRAFRRRGSARTWFRLHRTYWKARRPNSIPGNSRMNTKRR